MDARQRNTFKLLGHSYEDKDFHLAKNRSKNGVSFGIIANTTINKLLDRQNRTMRTEGAVTLTQELEKAEPEKFALLLPEWSLLAELLYIPLGILCFDGVQLSNMCFDKCFSIYSF